MRVGPSEGGRPGRCFARRSPFPPLPPRFRPHVESAGQGVEKAARSHPARGRRSARGSNAAAGTRRHRLTEAAPWTRERRSQCAVDGGCGNPAFRVNGRGGGEVEQPSVSRPQVCNSEKKSLIRTLRSENSAASFLLVGYSSGQRGQTVNLLAYAYGGSNPPPTTTFPRSFVMAHGYAVPRGGQAELTKLPPKLPLFPPVS